MGLTQARLLLLLCCFVCSYQLRSQFNQNPAQEWENMAKVIGEVASGLMPKVVRGGSPSQTSSSEFRKLPEYLVVASAKDPKALFKPEKGVRPLPNSVKDILFPSLTTASPVEITSRPKPVEMLCHIDRIYVRIRRDVFKTLDAYKHLKLGTCPVNQATKDHYYFLYHLTTDCDFKKESNVDDLTVRNVLHYLPNTAVLREMPFDVPLQCKYQRLLHSYKVGIWPKLQGATVFKSLKRESAFVLIPQDASGNEMTKPYILGQPMFFEAKRVNGTSSSADDRMYINKCFMASSQDPNSSPKYTIIDNSGWKAVCRVKVPPWAIEDYSEQLYMHCDISVGKNTPTEGLKACNYDPATRKWDELYGDHSVCTCCDSSCSATQQPRASRNTVTSHPWKVDFKEDNFQMKTLDTGFSFEDNEMNTDTDFTFEGNAMEMETDTDEDEY